MSNKEDNLSLYFKKWRWLAEEMEARYGVPACIILAQGAQETGGGQSELASRHNNHFGIKCFGKKCAEGHCVRYADDSPKDRFRKYASVRASFESHSRLLSGKRYGWLLRTGSDYRVWAWGLQASGYATDKRYAGKLVRIIETYSINQ